MRWCAKCRPHDWRQTLHFLPSVSLPNKPMSPTSVSSRPGSLPPRVGFDRRITPIPKNMAYPHNFFRKKLDPCAAEQAHSDRCHRLGLWRDGRRKSGRWGSPHRAAAPNFLSLTYLVLQQSRLFRPGCGSRISEQGTFRVKDRFLNLREGGS